MRRFLITYGVVFEISEEFGLVEVFSDEELDSVDEDSLEESDEDDSCEPWASDELVLEDS